VLGNCMLAMFFLGGIPPDAGVFAAIFSLLLTLAFIAGSLFTGYWVLDRRDNKWG